jgi:hypothetical protein
MDFSQRQPTLNTEGEIFLTNVNESVDVSDLTEFLEPKVRLLGLEQISHPNASAKSFLLRVCLEDEETVLSPDFWPLGLKFRRFVRPKEGRLARPA